MSSDIFGLSSKAPQAKVIYIPVPWEHTTSYGKGTAKGPKAILKASDQVDLDHPELGSFYEAGLHMLPIPTSCGAKIDSELSCNDYVYENSQKWLTQDKLIAIVGGDHSSPFGALQAIAEKHKQFGILHIDAHADTRKAYQGFTWSHASIMRNVIEKIPEVSTLVQVGIRDFCQEETDFLKQHHNQIKMHTDFELMRARFDGITWKQQTERIIQNLPSQVWISFDIDGLNPALCPTTGTPVPGGLSFHEAYFMISSLVGAGKEIIGFDLCEVGSAEWDGNVGARMLYHMTGWMLESLR